MDRGLQEAFDVLKEKLVSAPEIGLPDSQKEAFQIVSSRKAGNWNGGTNPSSDKYSLSHSLKEVGSYDKGMATRPLSSNSYL